MQTRTFPLGPMETNCYLIYSDKDAAAVDPGGAPDEVVDFLKQNKLALSHILLTHLHFDHTYGVRDLVKATGAKVLASDKDRYMLGNELGRGGLWEMPRVPEYEFSGIEPGKLDLPVGDCSVLATPGHSPGGLSFYFKELKAVFSGDSLFYRSIGRTDFPGGSQDVLLKSIRDQLFSLPVETRVFPGHGPSSSIGDEKINNPYSSDFFMI